MFEAYRIRPVLEWEDSDENRELEAFSSLGEAIEAKATKMRLDPNPDLEPRIFWTLYGVNPALHGIRTEDAIADLDSEAAALELLGKLTGNFRNDPDSTAAGYFTPEGRRPRSLEESNSNSIDVTLKFRIDLALLRKQKRALSGLREGVQVTAAQEDAAEGILNMLDHVQDSILDQGLASEEDIFPLLPQLFKAA